MFAGWMVAGMVLGAIAVVIVWTLIAALVVMWVEDHRHHHNHVS